MVGVVGPPCDLTGSPAGTVGGYVEVHKGLALPGTDRRVDTVTTAIFKLALAVSLRACQCTAGFELGTGPLAQPKDACEFWQHIQLTDGHQQGQGKHAHDRAKARGAGQPEPQASNPPGLAATGFAWYLDSESEGGIASLWRLGLGPLVGLGPRARPACSLCLRP
jgi:hypothetical protein